MTRSLRESDILRAVMDYLAAEKIPHWRMNSGAMAGSHKGKKWFVRFGEKGMADVLVIRSIQMTDFWQLQRVLWIEIKRPGERQTADQKAFQSYVESCGMRYAVVASIEDLRRVL
jgi:hypothetical protein